MASTSAGTPLRSVQRLTVFGAGLMGSGIVQCAAASGIKTVMCDVNEAALKNGRDIITKSLTRVARKAHDDENAQKEMIQSTWANIETTTSPQEAVADAELIIEAIVEAMPQKQELFGRLDTLAKPETIFASNTSSLAVSEIASSTSEARRERFAGVHFFNPVPAMKLVEVIRTPSTSDETLATVADFCKRLNKSPVSCRDTPGFIVNRLLVPYMLEALRMAERGEATPEDIDTAMRLGAGYPMGPFELSDFIGLDTLQSIAKGWREQRVETGEITSEAVAPVTSLDELVAQGHLGRKAGKGFYDHS